VMPVLVVVLLFCIQRRLSIVSCSYMSFSALTPLVERQEERPACKN